MHRPERFPTAILAAFSIMGIVYSTVAASGYWYWGNTVSPVAVYDLATNSVYSHSSTWHGTWKIDQFLAALVLITCAAKIPALVMVVEEMLRGVLVATEEPEQEEEAEEEEGRTKSLAAAVFVGRATIAGSALALSVIARNELGNVLSFIGGACSMCTSVLLPVAFYTSLAWHRLRPVQKMGLGVLAVVGVGLLTQVTWQDVDQLIHHSGGG